MDSGKIIRACLVGLPVGLIVIGAGCILYTTLSDPIGKTNAAVAPPLAALPPLTSISASDLESHVRTLTETIGERHAGKHEALDRAKIFLLSTLGPSNIGYQVQQQVYEVDGQKFANIIAELPGTELSDEVVIVGAHYDSAPGTPGADDNATGVAALISLASEFSKQPQRRTIRFVAFTNEEPPFFQTENMGSLRYAKSVHAAGDQVVAMVSLETMGYFLDQPGSQRYPPQIAGQYPDRGNYIAVVGNVSSKPLVEFTHESFAKTNLIPTEKASFPGSIQGIGWSDHWSFWEFDYLAVMITDTAPFRNPHYHQPSDTIEKIDFERYTRAVAAAKVAIEDLATAELPWASTQ